MTTEEAKLRKLTFKQEAFCQLYAEPGVLFGNGTQAYIEAYSVDLTKPGAYEMARSAAYDNLTKPHLLARIRKLLELGPLNPETVDRELAFVIMQSADMPTKLGGIREYNKMKGRITEKLDAQLKHTVSIIDMSGDDSSTGA